MATPALILDAYGDPIEQKAFTPDVFPIELLASPTRAGVTVTPQSALGVPAVMNAVTLISGAVGTLPLALYREEGQGKIEAIDHPAFSIVVDAANDWTSSGDLRRQLAIDALLHGDGFALANRLPSGEVFELIRAQPHSVTVYYDTATAEPIYRWQPQSGGAANPLDGRAQIANVEQAQSKDYHWSDVVHVSAPLSVNGVTGVAPIHAAREAISLAIVLEQYAARLFGNGARPSGILTVDGKLDPATSERMKESWQSGHAGANSGKTALLEHGLKFQQLSLNSVDSQFLEMRQFAIVEIARAFGVSPVMIGDASRATWSNAEQYNRQFLTYTLAPWLRSFEAAYKRVMIAPEERKTHSIAFDTQELLRGDLAARGAFAAQMRAAGVMSANELRVYEDLPEHPDGNSLDSPHVQSGAKLQQAAQ